MNKKDIEKLRNEGADHAIRNKIDCVLSDAITDLVDATKDHYLHFEFKVNRASKHINTAEILFEELSVTKMRKGR